LHAILLLALDMLNNLFGIGITSLLPFVYGFSPLSGSPCRFHSHTSNAAQSFGSNTCSNISRITTTTTSSSTRTTHHFPPTSRASFHIIAVSNYRQAIDWFRTETLQDLVPKQDALSILDELLSNEELINDTENMVIKNWDKLQGKLLEEKRSLAEILGKETTDRLLKSIENVEGYDPQAVRAFLGSEAVNKLLAQILYDGIYNFFQTIDVFGNIIGSLPIIGPIRNQIRDETKKNLDRTVGPLIQTFLRTYTKVAVLEASDFVLSPSNRKIFNSANVKLVSSLLERPVNSLVPPSELSQSLRDDLIDYLKKVETDTLEEYVNIAYDLLGDKSLDSFFNVNRVLDASPTLQSTIDRIWTRATGTNNDG